MAAKGELYQRKDGKWAFRVKAANGQIVATDGSQGYESKSSAKATLKKLLAGSYTKCEEYQRERTGKEDYAKLYDSFPTCVIFENIPFPKLSKTICKI